MQDVSRRTVLQGFTAAGAIAAQPEAAAALAKVIPAVPHVFSALFGKTAADRALHILLRQQSVYGPLSSEFKFDRFGDICNDVSFFLCIDPKDRRDFILKGGLKRIFYGYGYARERIAGPPAPLGPHEFADDEAMLAHVYREWDDLKKGLGERGISAIGSLRNHLMKDESVPGWWFELDERGKLHAWIEAQYLRHKNHALGYFFNDERLADLVRGNLEPLHRRFNLYPSRPPEFFSKLYGPRSGEKVFLRARAAALQAEGLRADAAQKKAARELKEATWPPVLRIARDEKHNGMATAAYRGELTWPDDAVSDSILLFKACFLIDEHMKQKGAVRRDYRIAQSAAGLQVIAAKGSTAATQMEALCWSCRTWNIAHFDDLPFNLPVAPGLWQNGPRAQIRSAKKPAL
jgi:hypothetical protein